MQTISDIPRLSKSRFQEGLQCPKRLWLTCHQRDSADPVDEAKQALFDLGHQVGELARERFPGGKLVSEDYRRSHAALRTTRSLLDDGVPCLYEGAFEYQGVLVRVDVLHRRGYEGWNLVEVKASTRLKPEHITDVAIQTYVALGSGLPVAGAYLMHLNNEYVYEGGDYDLDELFVLEDVTAQVMEYLPGIPARLGEMKAMLVGECPEVLIGRHCGDPYDCEFIGHCHSFLPEYPVTDLPRLADEVLTGFLERGLHSIKDIPCSEPTLTVNQRLICEVVQAGVPRFDEGLAAELTGLARPLHFLDFETVMPALPLYPHTSPYETIPVQWSCHTLHEDGTLEHHEFLHRQQTDPRPGLAEELVVVLAGPGTVVSYTGYEQRMLRGLAMSLPQMAADIAAIEERLFDLHKVIVAYVRHPEFRGSTSLKRVLPALVDDLSYEGLAVPDGQAAARRYQEAVWGDMSEHAKEEVFNDLLQYCGVDTLAMVRLYDELVRRG
jgi:hypothetical protein